MTVIQCEYKIASRTYKRHTSNAMALIFRIHREVDYEVDYHE